MKRLILIKIMQNPKAMKAIVKYLNGTLRKLPVKQIIGLIGPALHKIRALTEQVIRTVIEFAVKKAGKFPVFK